MHHSSRPAPAPYRVPTPAKRAPAPGPHPAGLVSRGLAALVDALVLALVALVVELGAACARFMVVGPPFRLPEVPNWVSGTAGWAIAVCYFAGSWVLVGASPGARLMGLRVGDRGGWRLRTVRALVRAALCVSFPVGLFWVPFSRRRAAIQDLVARTTVTYDRDRGYGSP